MEKPKQKISREVAEQEFIKFCDSWNIDTDEEDFDDEERQDYKTQKRKIIRAIRDGRLYLLEDNELLEYKLKKPVNELQKLTIKRPDGPAFLSMDKYKERESVHKTFSLIAGMCGENPKLLSRVLDGIDILTLMGINALFFGS